MKKKKQKQTNKQKKKQKQKQTRLRIVKFFKFVSIDIRLTLRTIICE